MANVNCSQLCTIMLSFSFEYGVVSSPLDDTAISRKVVGRNVHATIPKGNMGYDQYTVPDTVVVGATFATFF